MTTETVSITKPRRRRGLRFWAKLAAAILLLSPAVVYLGAILYVRLGFMDSSITRKLSRLSGGSAQVGEVRTEWLKNLRASNVTVEAADKSRPVTMDALTLDWDLGPLLRDNRIRSATFDRLILDLRRDAEGRWNLRPKPPAESEGGYRIEQLILRAGELSVEWGARRLRLQAVSGALADRGPRAASPYSLFGVFESLENVSMNGTLGPGEAWSGRAFGGARLERDLAGVLGSASGHVRFDLTARREALLVDTQRAGPLVYGGQLLTNGARWPISARRALDLPKRTVDFRGALKLPVEAVEPVFEELQLRVDNIGSLTGAGSLPSAPGLHLKLAGTHGALDADGINELFFPRLWGDGFTLKGRLDVVDLAASLPFSADAPRFALAAKLSTGGARLGFRSLGDLPLLDAAGMFAWPALKDVSLSLGDIGKATVSINDLYPGGEDFWLKFAEGVTVHDLNVDIGRFWESETGRRVLTATFDRAQPAPAASDLPYVLKGKLRGKDLKLAVQRSAPVLTSQRGSNPGSGRIELRGLQVEDAALARWPFAFNVPERRVSGELALSAKLAGGQAEEITVAGNLAGMAALALVPLLSRKGPAESFLMFEHTYFPYAPPEQRMGPVRIRRLEMPLKDVDQIFSISKRAGITGSGRVSVTDGAFDPISGAARGTIELKDVSLQIALSGGAQRAIVSALKLSNWAMLAPILEQYPIETVQLAPVSTQIVAERKDYLLTLTGQTQPIEMRAALPVLGDYRLATIPAAEFALALDLPPGGMRMGTLAIAFESGTKLKLTLKPGSAPGQWSASGTIEGPALGGLEASFETAFDASKKTVGPSTLSIKELDLAALSAKFAGAGVPALKGKASEVALELNPFALDAPASEIANGKLTGKLANAGVSSAQLEVDRLTGALLCNLKGGSDGVALDAVLRMESYEALLAGGAFYIPPPARGTASALRVAGRYEKREGGGRVNLDRLEVNLGDTAQLSAAGSLTLRGSGLSAVNLETLRLDAPDLLEARRVFGPPNLDNRAPWFGDIGLSGAGRFEGKLNWEAGGAELEGKFGFSRAAFTIGKTTPLTISDVNGEAPVWLRWGAGGVQDAGAPPKELRGALKFSAVKYPGVTARPQELQITATRNAFTVATPIQVETVAGAATIEGLAFTNSAITFRVASAIELDRMLRDFGLAIAGIEGLALTGEPIACSLLKTAGVRGPWELKTRGRLSGPFFGGEAMVENLNARGLFGPAPVFGGDFLLRGGEGVKITQLTEKNSRFGKIALRANVALAGFETTSASPEGFQKFLLEAQSVDFKENEFWYDGKFAMAVAPELMRAAFPRFLYSDEFLNSDEVRKLTFGVRKVGLQYRLADGFLHGPRPLLPDGLVIQAYGAGRGVGALFADRFKQDIRGDAEHKVLWAELVRQFRRATGKPETREP